MAAARKTKTSPTTIALAEIPGMTKARCIAYLDAVGIAYAKSAKVMDLRTLVHEHTDSVSPGKAAPTTMARTRKAAKPTETKAKLTEPLTRGQQARARQVALNNHRGKGRKLTDAELTDYIRKVQAAYPESTVRAEAEYAYWVEGIATGNARFARLWVEAEAKPAKRTTKR